jgi:hypothetical protein
VVPHDDFVQLTTDLVTSGAQVMPVLTIGAVVAFRARVRAHERMAQPLRSMVGAFFREVVALHQQGVGGQSLVNAVSAFDEGPRLSSGPNMSHAASVSSPCW